MKTLTLIRHAKSSWKYTDLADRDRPLNKRGKQDRYLIGQRLHEMGVQPDRIFSSPALRALKTANIIADLLDYPRNRIIIEESIYMHGADALLNLIRGLADQWRCVLLIGHNPDLTTLANDLTDAHITNIPTCGVASITLTTDRWCDTASHLCRLTHFDTPNQLAPDKQTENTASMFLQNGR
jgi:phosphohistidine phosphatase